MHTLINEIPLFHYIYHWNLYLVTQLRGLVGPCGVDIFCMFCKSKCAFIWYRMLHIWYVYAVQRALLVSRSGNYNFLRLWLVDSCWWYWSPIRHKRMVGQQCELCDTYITCLMFRDFLCRPRMFVLYNRHDYHDDWLVYQLSRFLILGSVTKHTEPTIRLSGCITCYLEEPGLFPFSDTDGFTSFMWYDETFTSMYFSRLPNSLIT